MTGDRRPLSSRVRRFLGERDGFSAAEAALLACCLGGAAIVVGGKLAQGAATAASSVDGEIATGSPTATGGARPPLEWKLQVRAIQPVKDVNPARPWSFRDGTWNAPMQDWGPSGKDIHPPSGSIQPPSRDIQRPRQDWQDPDCPQSPSQGGVGQQQAALKDADGTDSSGSGKPAKKCPSADPKKKAFKIQVTRYNRLDESGRPEEVDITGLGTSNVSASSRSGDGKSDDITDDIKSRGMGEHRDFKLSEKAFDGYTGLQWNWVGSSQSGGKPTQPGGIGDVDVRPLNEFDAAAKKHDIQSWLEANFEEGSIVNLRINGEMQQFRVKSFVDLNAEVVHDFGEATKSVLDRAMTRALHARDLVQVARILSLQAQMATDPLGVMYQVLHDPMFDPELGQSRGGRNR